MGTVHRLKRVEAPEYVCSNCGAERGCGCSAPPIERAAYAVAANPQKSDRAIAAETGVNRETVVRARKATGMDHTSSRIGRDGKVRRLPKQKIEKPSDEANKFIRRLGNFTMNFEHDFHIFLKKKNSEEDREALDNSLHHAAGTLTTLRQYLTKGRKS